MNAALVSVGLLLKDGYVLMGERLPTKEYPLHWEFPGGKLDTYEDTVSALRRELNEELAIDICDAEEWFNELALYSNGKAYDVTYFLVRSWKGEIVNREFNRIAWVSREMLPTLLHLSGNKRIVKRLIRKGILA